jgi:hypothetical protein
MVSISTTSSRTFGPPAGAQPKSPATVTPHTTACQDGLAPLEADRPKDHFEEQQELNTMASPAMMRPLSTVHPAPPPED